MYMKILLLLLILIFSSCSDKSPSLSTPAPQDQSVQKAVPKSLAPLILTSPEAESLSYLNSLKLNIDGKIPEMYLKMFKSFGLKESFLARTEFNKTDLFYLKQTFFFHALSQELNNKENKENKDLMKACYELTRTRIKGKFEGKDEGGFPLSIWQRGFGVCDRQVWVFCELAYQLGAEPYVVYLKDPETGVSQHTLCEVSYQGRKYIVDPLYGKFLVDTDIKSLSNEDIKKTWTQQPEIHADFSKAIIFNPCMPHDYSPRIQALGKYISKNFENSPRLGEDPIKRGKRRGFSKEETFIFWHYPLKVLNTFKLYHETEK